MISDRFKLHLPDVEFEPLEWVKTPRRWIARSTLGLDTLATIECVGEDDPMYLLEIRIGGQFLPVVEFQSLEQAQAATVPFILEWALTVQKGLDIIFSDLVDLIAT